MSTELKQGTPEWHAARIGRITASRVAAALNISPFTTRAALIREMVSEALGNKDDMDSPAMAWGRENEEKAAHIYEFLYAGDDEVKETGFWTVSKYMGASPDRLVGDEGLVEIKCPYKLREDANPHFNTIDEQPHYWHQIQCQLHCTGREWCDFFQWAPNGHRNERVYKDPEWLLNHDEALIEFYTDYQQALENASVGGPEERVGLSARWAAAVEAYHLAKKVKDAAQSDMDEAKEIMVALCKEAHIDQCSGAGMTAMKVTRAGSVDYRLMAQDNLPNVKDIEDEYRKGPSTYWKITEEKTSD